VIPSIKVREKVIIIGSGFAGLSAACFMAKAGWEVIVIEKHSIPGGRARQLKTEGFTFDMGPSWYWMPDVFERFFNKFDKKVSDYYQLKRLTPSYKVYWNDDEWEIPANYEALKKLFEQTEPGSGKQLDAFLEEAAYKYEVGINKLVYKPGRSITEFLDRSIITGVFKLDIFSSIKAHVRKYFKHPKLKELMEFPVLFLGALPEKTPALYSLMNYADIKGGTWYPEEGMYSVVKAMYKLASDLGVKFNFNHTVTSIEIREGSARGVATSSFDKKQFYEADVVIGAADYHHIETALLAPHDRSYSEKYWSKRIMAPSCLLYYVGLNKRLTNILHHSLFFDSSFEVHGREIYETFEWPKDPLFYVSATSVTDNTVAPAGCENLFLLIPVAAGLNNDDEELRDRYFNMIIERMEKRLGTPIKEHIIFKQSYAHSDFVNDYNSFKGNAYGLANTLLQTAVLKPACKSKKVKNLFYTGQLTVPGPGVPPSLISGEVVSKEVLKAFANKK
jgi:phytoene desaturase